MARDENSAPRRPRRSSRGGTVLGVLLGLVVGAVVAVGIAWYIAKTPMPFASRTKDAPSKIGDGPKGTVESAVSSGQAPVQLPGKPGDKLPADKPRFEFYKILPGGEDATPVPSPKVEAKPASQPEQKPEQKAETKPEPKPVVFAEPMYLQAGAFSSEADADNLRARLALLGLEAGLQQVNVPEKGVLHRVRLGPYSKPDEMNRTRSLLAQNGIEAAVVKLAPR